MFFVDSETANLRINKKNICRAIHIVHLVILSTVLFLER
jgi:hypothetical protein